VAAQRDLTGQVVVITGANSGIGREAAVALARMGATVVVGARDPILGEKAAADVGRRARSDTVVPLVVDLSSFASVRTFAEEVLTRFARLDVLVNNAGLVLEERRLTREGHEMTIGVNHLGHFLLTELLRDRLVASAPSRVVVVSSTAHHSAGAASLIMDPESESGYFGFSVYAKSKLANIIHTRELARRLEGTGVTANCLHPGIIRSGFGRDGDAKMLGLMYLAGSPFLLSPRRGARTTVHLASSPAVEGLTGGYYAHRRVRPPSADAQREDAAAWLWDWSEAAVAAAEPMPGP
jgi:NAD(P)-dependent dehydrogenase (short-subunit alcohol dehydrogenase family)